MTTKFVSVIIPVYNDSQRLKLCLESLFSQTYPSSYYEVIVVDNNSTDNIQSIVSQFPQVIYTEEKQIGSYAARNKGISLAKGEVISFTDSDCIPYPNWIEKGIENISKIGEHGLIGGKIELLFKDPNNLTAVELYERLSAFPQESYINNYHFSATANLFTTQSTLKEVGVFNSSIKSGGDYEWGRRVYKKGYTLKYVENVVIKHPARYSYQELYNKKARVYAGKWSLERQTEKTPYFIAKQVKLLFFLLVPPVRVIPKLIYDDAYKDLSIFAKLKYLQILYFLRLVNFTTIISLLMGQEAKR